MNEEQVKSAIRWVIAVGGPLLISWGVIPAGSVETLTTLIISLTSLAWSMFVHTQTNAIAVVDDIAKDHTSPIKALIAEPTTAGQALAKSLPGKTTVVAGTPAAAAAVKS